MLITFFLDLNKDKRYTLKIRATAQDVFRSVELIDPFPFRNPCKIKCSVLLERKV